MRYEITSGGFEYNLLRKHQLPSDISLGGGCKHNFKNK